MNLIFDLTKTQPIGGIKFHGGGKYGEIVLKSLIKKTHNIIVYYDSQRWLNPEIEDICKDRQLVMIDSCFKGLNQVVDEFNGVVYSPIIETDIKFVESNIPYITTIHGLRILEFPYDNYMSSYKSERLRVLYKLYYKWKAGKTFRVTLDWYRKVFNRSNIHIVTVSEHSKASILSFIPSIKPENIKVFYSPSTTSDANRNVEPYLEEKYYLLVSSDRWIKNALRAIIAFEEIFKERPDFKGKVILTGLKNKSMFKKYIKDTSRYIFLDYVDDEILLSLYKGAYLLVYPSLNEGFGYPPIEAMNQGTPIIASAISSIPEICDNSVLYFNPIMVSEIKMRILQMENEELRDEYIKRISKRVSEVRIKQDEDLQKLTSYIISFIN